MLDNSTQKFSTAGKSSQRRLQQRQKEVIVDVGSHIGKKTGIQECEDTRAHLCYYTTRISSSTFLKFEIVQG